MLIKKQKLILLSCLCIMGGFLFSTPVSAYSMSINTGDSRSVDITTSDDSSTSARITSDEVEIITNCRAGYNLTLATSVNDNNLYLSGDSSNNTSGTYFAPSNGSTALNNAPNTWGYYFSSYSRGQTPTIPTTTSVFSPVPALGSTPAVLKTTTQTASSTDINDTLYVYLGVAMDNGMAPGSYKMIPESNQNNAPDGSLTYYLTMDGGCRNYTVEYNANGGTGTMTDQDINAGEAVKLKANSFTAPALGQSYQDADGNTITADPDKLWTFWGWNTEVDGTGDWYKDRESITDITTAGSTITLYAQWKQATLDDMPISTSGTKTIIHDTMQDMNGAICWNSDITTKAALQAANKTGAVTLTDNRDGTTKSYDVSKLADGNCWMTTNLALGTTSTVTLTSDDTDLEDNTTFTLPAGDTTSNTTYNNAKIRLTNASGATTNGVYYTWPAAVASTTSTNGTPTTSICPKNWDLPTNDQFSALSTASAYSSTNPTTDLPSQFLTTGKFTNGANFYPTSTEYGFYWTSTSSTTSAAYGRRVNSTTLYSSASTGTTYGGNKYYRKNVRCVANAGSVGIIYHSNNTADTTSTQSVNLGGSGTLAASNLFTAESHKQFKEWNTMANGTGTSYNAGANVSTINPYPGQSLDLYAIWDDVYIITFVNTDGGATQTKNIVQGQSGTVSPATTWSRTNYRLMGWDTNSAGTNVVYTNGQTITPSSDITVYTVWKPTYTIQYNGNGADDGVMTNVKHTNVGEGDVLDLYASNFSRANYGFAGWSFDQNAQPGGASRIYGPNEAIEAPAATTSGETKTLYAIWVPAETGVYMQTWNGCSSMSKGDVIALKDQRDANTYAIAKLEDNNCWMIENLRLESTNSDNSTGSLAQGYSNTFSGLADAESTWANNATTANSLYSTSNITGSNQGSRFPRYNNANTQSRAGDPISGNVNIYIYGNYYTWPAAIADTTDYYSGSNNVTMHTSICPKGWQLPYGRKSGDGNTSGGFYYLGVQLGATASSQASSRIWRSYPNNFVLSGKLSNGYINSQSSAGYYWSSTNEAANYPYSFMFNSTAVSPGTEYNTGKSFGVSIRCVAEPTAYNVAFNANGGTGTMTAQEIEKNEATKLNANSFTAPAMGQSYQNASGTTITATANKFWTFWGWNTAADGSGDWYKDKESVTNLVNPRETITLYAQWKQATLSDLTAATAGANKTIDHDTMQDMSAETCWNSAKFTAIGTAYGQATLKDTRDGNTRTYTVAKLPDGLCWMTQNLNLGTNTAITLTSDDTDLAEGTTFTLPASNATDFSTSATEANYNKATVYNDVTVPDYTANSTVYSGKVTGYYSYAAATADTATYDKSSATEVTTSICPKNWDLPTNTQYYNLRTTGSIATYNNTDASYAGKNAGNEPYFFIYGGYRKAAGATVNTTNFSNPTSNGYLWTANNYSRTQSRGTYVYSSGLYNNATGSTQTKYYGLGIRCVADAGTVSISYHSNNTANTTSTQDVSIGPGKLAASSLFTAESNKQFREWNTAANGTGTSYAAATSVSSLGLYPGQSLDLYAIWDDVYYIAFSANGGSGTMTNQTVVRDAATAIKTNTFTYTGYIFKGWNTKANGTGTFYTDRQKVNNLTATGNTITLYAVWVDGAYLDTGSNVNQKLKRLAGNSSATYSTQDTAITAIARANALPSGFTASSDNTISDSSSPHPIYAWYDSANTTIYYYSEATNIFMNKTSDYFFYQMRALSNLSTISAWDTSKVTSMAQMFYSAGYNATTFTLDLSSWNTASVTNMFQMFQAAGYSASSFTLDLSSWNTSSVTNMSSMFNSAGYNATTWSIGNLSNWNTSSVTDMSSMFASAGYSATTWSIGNLSNWNTSSVANMSSMFYHAGYNVTTWSIGNLSSWNTSSVTNMNNMFSFAGHNATTWSIGNLSNWNTSSVTNMAQMFQSAGYSASSFTLDLSSWNTSSVTSMLSMFSYAGYSATTFTLDLSGWNTASVTNMSQMFYYAGYSATTWSIGNLSSWNTSSVTNMQNMFSSAGYNATTFTLDLSSWNTSAVTTMQDMFSSAGCNATTWSVGNLSNWNTASVTNMHNMFSSAGHNATIFTLDLSSWNTASVTNMTSMFREAGYSATTWSVTIPKTNNGTANGPIANTTSNLYGSTTSVTATPRSGKSFTLAN